MSRFLKDTKALFLHIPRTGGSWVERAMRMMQLPCARWTTVKADWLPKKHLYFPQYVKNARKKVNFQWTIIRHPVDYWQAIWRWMTDVKQRHRHKLSHCLTEWKWHPQARAIENYDPSFDKWVERMLEDQGAWATRNYFMYIGPPGGEWCHYVGRFESLEDDFFDVLRLLGYHEKIEQHEQEVRCIGKVNQNKRPVVAEWRKDLLQQVYHEERVAIRRWWSEETWYVRHYGALAYVGIEDVLADKEHRTHRGRRY